MNYFLRFKEVVFVTLGLWAASFVLYAALPTNNVRGGGGGGGGGWWWWWWSRKAKTRLFVTTIDMVVEQ
jgi:hypothetical protein